MTSNNIVKMSERRMFPSRDIQGDGTDNHLQSTDVADGYNLNTRSSSENSPLKVTQFKNTCVNDQDGLKVIIISLVTFTVAVTVALIVQIYNGNPEVRPHGTVVSDSEECSNIGTLMLKKGGSAVDAAIAVMICLGVVHPHVTGIGGGGFMLIHKHSGKMQTTAIDFREAAPADILAVPHIDKASLTIGVPGQLQGLHTAHRLFGKLPWAELIKPAADLARSGFNVSRYLYQAFQPESVHSSEEILSIFDPLLSGPPTENQFVTRLKYAAILENIADHGADAFYVGELGRTIVEEIRRQGGVLNTVDFQNYSAISREPLQMNWKIGDPEYVIQLTPSPSSGPALLMALQILDSFNFTTKAKSSEATKDIVQAMQIAAMKMAELGDLTLPFIKNLTEEMLNESTYQNLSSVLQLSAPALKEDRASSVIVTDSEELYVSMISGLGSWFGSGIVTSAGIILNDALRAFFNETEIPNNSRNLYENNFVAPWRRPLSSETPIIVFNKNKVCGLRIATSGASSQMVLEALLQKVAFHKSTLDAVEAGRYYASFTQKDIFEEQGHQPSLEKGTAEVLRSMGYEIKSTSEPYISINMLTKEQDLSIAQADSRGGGLTSQI